MQNYNVLQLKAYDLNHITLINLVALSNLQYE